ncbi:iron-sulfur cluster-binding domain-containing protein [Mesorhizobium sp. MSK_1335]|uniref:Iron-sulfur cluster-binding domain-containing protein n=1 Tax=Mesorhizobium montanum TaxID=3072323 RepID=A0ABU4ZGW8_9HYPH|nr:iron-sulfur cluster-binding domain-containing protein [Mesorhizobium sp. MSK_1335]MDX8524601.1 iron-sulfur cluster-binding domain-containing protein [Mesorhizobium sp. MSK_1335]
MNVVPALAGNGACLDTSRLCICTDRIQETSDVVTLVFERIDGRGFKFLAGQFVTIRFCWNGEQFSRVFTIASPPSRPQRIALTIKAARDGKATRILHNHFGEGATVEISEAGGEFTLEGRAFHKALFLCAGSGITPFMSMLRSLNDAGSDLDIKFIQCARTPDDVLFEDELRNLARAPRLRVETVCSRVSGDPGASGRLTVAKLAELVPDASERTVFLCGPTAFMEAMRRHLLELRVPASGIFEEAFGTTLSGAIKPSGREDQCGEARTILFQRSGINGAVGVGQTILELAEAAGIHVETSCRMGLCGTCKVRLASGAVEMNDMGGLSDAERGAGFVLACCSTPTSDVAIDL